ncbi:FAD:protein FMN transferase [Pseudarthrobacter sp. J1763]|uniref:FAD:protein FMN transferase n=1 Tax=Pseudarthrobacter sp. J1763 TaxID=3420445 RepID=UPI003D26D4BD
MSNLTTSGIERIAQTNWKVWGLEASLTVTDASVLNAAEEIVREVIAQVDAAGSRFRPDSELAKLQPELASGATVSSTLALLVAGALDAARWTDGAVDPTLGRDMDALGYDRDLTEVKLRSRLKHPSASSVVVQVRTIGRAPGWERVKLTGRTLQIPQTLRLDLGATAKAIAADMAADRVAATLGTGVLVSLGGDIATAGPAPLGGWQVLVQDLAQDPWQQVGLAAGHAMATSSTQKRRWVQKGKEVHHILDPRFGTPAEPVWRSVTVAAPTCLQANAYSTAGIVRGFGAVDWFKAAGVAARFVDQQHRVVTTGGWPAPELGR